MILTAETLGIDLVNILRAGRPRSKPSVLRNHLDSTERKAVAPGGSELRSYQLAGKSRHANLIRRQRLQQLLLFRGRGRVDPLVEGRAQLAREANVDFAWVPPGLRGGFRGKQTKNYPILVCGPD